MKAMVTLALLLGLVASARATTGDVNVLSWYNINNTDDYNSSNNHFYARETITGPSHGSFGQHIKPESGDYERDAISDEATTASNANYSADTPLTFSVQFAHTTTGTTLASCSHSVPFTAAFAPRCTPFVYLEGNASTGYTCHVDCDISDRPANLLSTRRAAGALKK
jgi:hypothetical protein